MRRWCIGVFDTIPNSKAANWLYALGFRKEYMYTANF